MCNVDMHQTDMEPLNVGLIRWDSYPPDMRSRRILNYITNNGHDVHFFCENDGSQSRFEVVDGVEVERVNAQNESVLRKAFFHATLMDYSWCKKMKNSISIESFDLLHVIDLNPLRTILLAKEGDIPVVADLRELYPESLKAHKRSMKIHQRFLRPIWRYKRLEREVIKKVDGLIVESSTAKAHYIEKFDFDPERVVVSRNVPDLQELETLTAQKKPIEYSEDFIITYVGNFTSQRDLRTLLHAISNINEDELSIRLLMVGDGADRERLESLADELGISEIVEFTGWVSLKRMFDYLAVSDIGISLCEKGNKDSECAIPNKIFQYMYMRVPVIAGNLNAMKEVIDKTDAGIVIPPENPEQLAQAIRKLYHSRDLVKRLGNNGHEAVVNEYNFAKEGSSLIEIYQKVL